MDKRNIVQMQEVTSVAELTQAQKQREQFDRNSAWLQDNIVEIYAKYRGKCICVTGKEVFVADIASDAIAQATAVHLDDEGWFTRYILKDRVVPAV